VRILTLLLVLAATRPLVGYGCADPTVTPSFEPITDGVDCELTSSGELHCQSPGPLSFRIQLDRWDCVERAYAKEHHGGVVLIYEYGDVESGASAVLRISPTGTLVWKTRVGGFNVGEPLVEGNAVYVTAIGFVGRLNLTSGKWIWRHEGLYGASRFGSSFETPFRHESGILFRERPAPGQPSQREILVDAETGEILHNDDPPGEFESEGP